MRAYHNDYTHVTGYRPHDGGPIVAQGLRIFCSQCARQEVAKLPRNTQYSCSQIVADKMWRAKGWFVGKSRKYDVCPTCVREEKARRDATRQADTNHTRVEVVTMSNKVVSFSEAPRQMTRDDRRLVFGKIDEVYVDGTEGYSSGWTDQKVATDLGVPVAWVKLIREENFGPEGLNNDYRNLIADGKKIMDAFRAEKDAFTQQLSEHHARVTKLHNEMLMVEKKLASLEKTGRV